ncbi:MFS transporter [soil metagenome]
MLDPYRRILVLPGALAFSLAGLLARAPISMVSLGIVLLVADRTGSYGYAGAVAASQVVAGAVCTPVQGRLMDRFGQFRLLPVAGTVFAAGVLATAVAVESGQAAPVPHVCAAVAGAGLPPVGSAVRARWRHLLEDRAQLDTTFALEAVVDEIVFVVGPVLVTLLATQLPAWSGLAVAGALGLTGALVLASQRATEPPVAPRGGDRHRTPMSWPGLACLAVVGAGLGGIFGATEVVTVAFADEAGTTAAAGPMLAVWATGSLLAGLIIGTRTQQRHALTRLRWSIAGLTAAMAVLAFLPGITSVTVVLFVAGFAIAPTLIATISLVEQTVPRSRLTEGISWISTGIAAGVAPGAAISGQVIDAAGASVAYLVPLASGLLAVLASFMLRRPSARGL